MSGTQGVKQVMFLDCQGIKQVMFLDCQGVKQVMFLDCQEDSESSDLYAVPVKRRQRKGEELPPGWEKHEVRPPSLEKELVSKKIFGSGFLCLYLMHPIPYLA